MQYLLSDALVFSDNKFNRQKFSFFAGAVSENNCITVDASDYYIFPGFADVHVHFREPGFSYKETIATGSAAAARGGYTAVCTMPNLSPTPDCPENLRVQLDPIERDAVINVIPFGSITRGEKGKELSDIEGLAPYVCGFSDDGVGVNDEGLMREAMRQAVILGKVISAHCEDTSCEKDSPESEWREVERDLRLAQETGCAFHACHISTKESVALIREAKRSGINVTCETAPHYLLLSEADRLDEGRFKMNPPLRTEADRTALLEGLCDGTVDMIATDHAPHSAEEKSRGYNGSLNGIVGLETAFPVLYTDIVRKGIISLERLIELMSIAPAKRFGFESNGFTVFDLKTEYILNRQKFLSKGRSTPFDGWRVFGKCLATVYDGRFVWKNKNFNI